MKKFLLLCILQLGVMQAQDYFPTNTAVKAKELNYQAFTNATIHLNPTTFLKNATLLEQNGRIIAVGQNIELPKNTGIFDKSGTHIYPSFIELNSSFVKPTKPNSGNAIQKNILIQIKLYLPPLLKNLLFPFFL
ncbi:MAG: hypothetical protein ACO3J1_02820 [Flavobacteriaceae bacterium]